MKMLYVNVFNSPGVIKMPYSDDKGVINLF